MDDDDKLRTAARSAVQQAERHVDVARDLEAFRRRLTDDQLAHARPDRPTGRWSRTAMAVAAGAVLVVGAGAIALSRDGGPNQIATSGTTPSVAPPQSTITSPAVDGDEVTATTGSPSTSAPSTSVPLAGIATCEQGLIRQDLGTPAEVVGDRCDGTWAVVDVDPANTQSDFMLARLAEGEWMLAVRLPARSLCAGDLLDRGVSGLVVDGVEWTCAAFDRGSIEYRPEPDSGTMVAGDQGPRVRALQGELVRQGRLADADVDGSFGEVTRSAIIDHQLATGLVVTAEADIETLRLLRLLPDERVASSALVATGSTLGTAVVGMPADEAIEYLTEVLGPPDRDERADIEFPAFAYCRDWQPRILDWSNLRVFIARWDLSTDAVTSDPRLFAFSYSEDETSRLGAAITSSSGASVGEPLSRWTELHPDADVDLEGPVDYIGPIVTLTDGLTGSIDVDAVDNRITSLYSAGPFVCDE